MQNNPVVGREEGGNNKLTTQAWLILYSIVRHSAKESLAPSTNWRWVIFKDVGDFTEGENKMYAQLKTVGTGQN